MDEATRLLLLKIDLQITTDKLDDYLKALLVESAADIKHEGVTLADTTEDGMLVVHNAAYIYRKRREQETSKPRYLRWMLNNRKVSKEATPVG